MAGIASLGRDCCRPTTAGKTVGFTEAVLRALTLSPVWRLQHCSQSIDTESGKHLTWFPTVLPREIKGNVVRVFPNATAAPATVSG